MPVKRRETSTLSLATLKEGENNMTETTDSTDRKTEEDWNGLKTVLKTVHAEPNNFSKFISAVCNFKNKAQEKHFFVSNFLLCHVHVISLLTLSSIAIKGE